MPWLTEGIVSADFFRRNLLEFSFLGGTVLKIGRMANIWTMYIHVGQLVVSKNPFPSIALL